MEPHTPAKPTTSYKQEVDHHMDQISERIVRPRRRALKYMITTVMKSLGLHPERFPVLQKEADILAYQIELTGVCAGYESYLHLRPHVQNQTSKLDRIISLMESSMTAQAGPILEDQSSRLKKILSVLERPICIFGLALATALSIIVFCNSAIGKVSEKEALDQDQLRQRIEESDLKLDRSLAAINKSMSAVTSQGFPDVIAYQESGGKTYVRLPNGSWKPVRFENVTPTNNAK